VSDTVVGITGLIIVKITNNLEHQKHYGYFSISYTSQIAIPYQSIALQRSKHLTANKKHHQVYTQSSKSTKLKY